MNALKMCLNWRVIAGVALVAVALFVYAPGFAAAALPFLVLAICPLSMIFMMGAMKGMGSDSKSGEGCAMSGSARKQSEGREGQLAQLKAQQQELSSKIAELEAEDEEVDSNPQGKPLIGAAVR